MQVVHRSGFLVNVLHLCINGMNTHFILSSSQPVVPTSRAKEGFVVEPAQKQKVVTCVLESLIRTPHTHAHTHTKRHFYLSHTRTDGSFCTMHSLASSNLNHHILMSPEQDLHLKMEG